MENPTPERPHAYDAVSENAELLPDDSGRFIQVDIVSTVLGGVIGAGIGFLFLGTFGAILGGLIGGAVGRFGTLIFLLAVDLFAWLQSIS